MKNTARLLPRLRLDHLPACIVAHVEVTESGCWQWTKDHYWTGYGRVKYLGIRHRAHRLAWTLLVGPIPEGMVLHHRCHDADPDCPGGTGCLHRRCMRPLHLEPMTQQDNMDRAVADRKAKAA